MATEKEKEIKPSDDAIAIADAIFAGLTEIARAIDRYRESMNTDEDGEPVLSTTYLDGSKMK